MRRPEEQLHRAVVDLLWVYACFGHLAYAHVPNGELRAKATAGRLKGMGVRPGVPDLLVWAGNGVHFGLELKAGRRGLTPEQVVWHSTLAALGHRTYVCRSIDEVEAALRAEGIPPVGTMGCPSRAAGGPPDAPEDGPGTLGTPQPIPSRPATPLRPSPRGLHRRRPA